MTMEVVEARPWQEYADQGKTLLAQFGGYDLVREGTEEPTSAEDYALAKMAAKAPAMHWILVAVAAGSDSNAVRARELLREIGDAADMDYAV